MQVFLHGLGQTPESWKATIAQLPGESLCANLPQLLAGKEPTYANLYQAFVQWCEGADQPIDLCGLSLGGVLAMNYAIEHPEKVGRLALIAAPFQMPKKLLRFQNLLFRLMPKRTFDSTGFSKAAFLQLCKTMMSIDFSGELSRITCPTLILCGENDKPNRTACDQLANRLGTELRLVPRAGHEVNIDAPEALAALLEKFFD